MGGEVKKEFIPYSLDRWRQPYIFHSLVVAIDEQSKMSKRRPPDSGQMKLKSKGGVLLDSALY